ncbi:hypothetical protein TREMEDRAFT_37809 [Tremella mesenterica DSM 1558]|uniref:uncharacterized protein n=1 Tax=Tremella mesenterica (strain ATCC 24925 / CBS 8224 / DSM 1558 / NBRC 9311 / NRRL Y-6157 / RJB 2259-6 / UBC 559-6) TaxID=578456 RepID=UPI0003F494AF|nr:uncharacterized protein TREMEDRAFT_37809 [Tremella mesenterica DSM 1558]EIW71429.1 hypothetical protein TREMEDRAFT_37809 [Tremella mesenterica DSM 1558]
MSTKEEIPALSFILEPALVASLLTIGCLLNRRSPADIRLSHAVLSPSPTPSVDGKPSTKEMKSLFWTLRVPDNSRFRMNLGSRVLGMFPFLMEVWYWLLTYWTYQIARAMQALTMGPKTTELAEKHSKLILHAEKFLHIAVERGLQRWVMKHEILLFFFNKTYAMVHIPATIAFMAYAYRFFPAPIFQSTRRTLVLSNCIAFIIFSTWPCMPPRLLPKEYGYVDTLHVGKAASIWTTNKFQNQLAAFPSLHFGYSFVIGVSLFLYTPHRFMRWVAPLYPILILLVIMATANHYLLDAVGGLFVTILAYRANRLLLNLRPIEEWWFWALRTEKPMDKADFENVVNREKVGQLAVPRDMSQRPLLAGIPE